MNVSYRFTYKAMCAFHDQQLPCADCSREVNNLQIKRLENSQEWDELLVMSAMSLLCGTRYERID